MNITDLANKYEVPIPEDGIGNKQFICTVALTMYKKGVVRRTICEGLGISNYQLTKWIDETSLRPPSKYKGPKHFYNEDGTVTTLETRKSSNWVLVDRMADTKKPKCKGDNDG